MGCTGEVQAVKDQMMLLKLQRMEVQMAKEKEIKKLSDIEGRPIKRGNIPDYIDPEFAREKNIATDYVDINDIYDGNDSEDNKKEKKANKKRIKIKKKKMIKRKAKKVKRIKRKKKIKKIKRKNKIFFINFILYVYIYKIEC